MYWKTYYNGFNRYIVYHHSNMIWFRLITNNPSMKKKQVILCLLVIRTSLTSRTLVVWKFTGPFPTLCISLLLYVKNLRTTHKQNCSMADCGRPTILQDPEKILNLQDLIDHQSPNLKSMRYYMILWDAVNSRHVWSLKFQAGKLGIACCPLAALALGSEQLLVFHHQRQHWELQSCSVDQRSAKDYI